MGVPAFFRWLQNTYSGVVVSCIEEREKLGSTKVDARKPNPNGVEFDNLYLDMNGIIHPCTHPENKPAPKDEDEMMVAIFEYIDRLFDLVRPRKLLYMAVDGVAPRAKMNQQRSRRFLSKKEAAIKQNEIAEIRSNLESNGCYLPLEKTEGKNFDSNCITPGTPFMEKLAVCLNYYVHSRMNSNPAWKKIKVILSDASVPGEGEHKIMDFIRCQRGQPDYNPNTWHCMCGADADLIMLGLATHEPKFTIIREVFDSHKPKTCDVCYRKGHSMESCRGLPRNYVDNEMENVGDEPEFIFVHLHLLRERLRHEFRLPYLPFKYDFERVIDDWIFLCFFVGNDFLPKMPSIDIYYDSIPMIMNVYKTAVFQFEDYLTYNGKMNLQRVLQIVKCFNSTEREFFNAEDACGEKLHKDKGVRKFPSNARSTYNSLIKFVPEGNNVNVDSTPSKDKEQKDSQLEVGNVLAGKCVSTSQFEVQTMQSSAPLSTQNSEQRIEQRGTKRKFEESFSEKEEYIENNSDQMQNNEDGYKSLYYEAKFDVDGNDRDFRLKVAREYVRGLAWVLGYYFQGCRSWKWFYPYHYAPLATDVADVEDFEIEFEKGKPFQPLEQLMGVFPAASSSHVPPVWAPLMSNLDSPILDFYPIDFKIDLNGKRFLWQGVSLLPFVNEERLKNALVPHYKKLSKSERKRNKYGDDILYISPGNLGYKYVTGLYKKLSERQGATLCAGRIFGRVLLAKDSIDFKGGTLDSPVRNLEPVSSNRVVCVRFRNPLYPESHVFPAKRLQGALDPPRMKFPSGQFSKFRRGNPRGRGRGNPRGRTFSTIGYDYKDHQRRSFGRFEFNNAGSMHNSHGYRRPPKRFHHRY